MNKIYTMIALITAIAPQIHAQNPKSASTEAVQAQHHQTGPEKIHSIRLGFEGGSYDAFLANLNSDYQQFIKNGKLAEFAAMRDIPSEDEKVRELAAHWEKLLHQLTLDRNAELVKACDGTDQIACQSIQSLVATLPADQTEALQYLSSLRFKNVPQGQNADEQKLIEIDLAAEFKMVHLDAQYAGKPFADRFEKQVVIEMDMMKQMQEASKTFQDSKLRKKIDLAVAAFDAWQARNWDLNLLRTIVKKPTNDVEKKIASILLDYQTKKEDLYQKEFLAKLDR